MARTTTIVTALVALTSCPKTNSLGLIPEQQRLVGAEDDIGVRGMVGVEEYGLDVSFPIHHAVSTNYAWLPHNSDPANNPLPLKYKDMPLQPLGDRQSVYTKHLEGCRDHYADDGASHCEVFEYERLMMNAMQPQSMQNYTNNGFLKVRTPEALKELVDTFWSKNRLKQEAEKWKKGDPSTNHWKSPTQVVSVDDKGLRGSGANFKNIVWEAIQGTIEEWTGEELTPMSINGVRVYTNGAIVMPHVDRLPFVTSAFINVAQDVDDDWPLEIYDHNGRAHNITLHPGDMLLLESHSVIHGHPFPLNGRYYAMLEVYFEPTGHSLRHAQNTDVSMQNKQPGEVGDAFAAVSSLPPYIKRHSPEEEHWRALHPDGWRAPAASPTAAKSVKASEIQRAAAKGDIRTIEKEIEKMSDQKKIVNDRDENGWQPIHEAAAAGHRDVVELLVDNGAQLNARTGGGRGGTPLYIATERHGIYHPIVRYLKRLGALSIGPEL